MDREVRKALAVHRARKQLGLIEPSKPTRKRLSHAERLRRAKRFLVEHGLVPRIEPSTE